MPPGSGTARSEFLAAAARSPRYPRSVPWPRSARSNDADPALELLQVSCGCCVLATLVGRSRRRIPSSVASVIACDLGQRWRPWRTAMEQPVRGGVDDHAAARPPRFPDADGAGAPPALETVQRLLGQVGPSVDAVHDLQRVLTRGRPARRARSSEPASRTRSASSVEAEAEQRIDARRSRRGSRCSGSPSCARRRPARAARRSARPRARRSGRTCISLSVIAERCTISRHRPV